MKKAYDPVGVLGNYLNATIINPQFPRILVWTGRYKSEDDERTLETYFIANRGEKILKPFSITDWETKSFSPSRDVRISLNPFLKIGSLWSGLGKEIIKGQSSLFREYLLEIPNARISQPARFHTLEEFKQFRKVFPVASATAKSFVISFAGIDCILKSRSKSKKVINLKRLIIPCSEIARFYFFNSSTLTKLLLKPGSLSENDNSLFVPSEDIRPVKGDAIVDKPRITVRVLNYDDVLIISRIAFSREAKNAVSIIQRSALDETTTGGYIESNFPFSGRTQLRVRGIEVNNGKEVSLIVLQLITCTGHFPFEELDYTYARPIAESDENGKGSGSGTRDPKPKKPRMTPEKPTSLGGTYRVTKTISKRFLSAPSADKVRYHEADKKSGENSSGKQYDPDGISDGENTRGDGSNQRRPKLEALNKEDEEFLEKFNLDRFETFLKVKGELDKFFDVSLVAADLMTPNLYPIHLKDFMYKSWCYVAVGTARGVAIAEFEFQNSYFYLFEHQQRHSEKIGLRLLRRGKNAVHAHEEIGVDEIQKILLSFARSYGGLADLRKEYLIESFRHTAGDSVERLCNNILSWIGYKIKTV